MYGSSNFSKSHAYDGFGVTLGWELLVAITFISILLGMLAGFFIKPISIII